jgi:hypothetical protein
MMIYDYGMMVVVVMVKMVKIVMLVEAGVMVMVVTEMTLI